MRLASTPRTLGLALLAVSIAIWAAAAELSTPIPDPARSEFAVHVRNARSLLRSGRIRQAFAEAAAAERVDPGRAESNALLGDIDFRLARFEAADRYFKAALAIDSKCSQAYLGLGRLDQIHFRRRAALQRIVTAYGLDPNDPETVLAYSSVASDREQEMVLLERFLARGGGMPREQLESALGRLQFYRRLGSRRLSFLEGTYQRYLLPMDVWSARSGLANGLMLAVSINGSKPLRLVFDTGAAGIAISPRSGEKLGLEYIADGGLRGVGQSGVGVRKMLAESVRIGDLRLRNCVVDVADRALADDIDGVIGASLFQQFIVRLDARRRTLELLPYPDEAPWWQSQEHLWAGRDRRVPAGMEGLTPVCQTAHLLLVSAKLGKDASGYLVLDTGAAFSSVSREMAVPFDEPPEFDVSGPGGSPVNALRAGSVQLHVAGRDLTDPNAVRLDFARLSNLNGVEISGLIGYPMLSRCTLTLDYRDGLIGLDPSR
jgi:tetratricopeptide (TPR) repeat protein